MRHIESIPHAWINPSGRADKVEEISSPGAHCEELGEQIGDLEQKEQDGSTTHAEQGELNSKRELWEHSNCGIIGQ